LGTSRLTAAAREAVDRGRAAVCTVCGRLPSGRFYVSSRGEVTCVAHLVAARCILCSLPTDSITDDWKDLGDGVMRCPTCGVGAVADLQAVRAHLPTVRAELAGLGFGLERRVRVQLVTATELRSRLPESGTTFGVTRVSYSADGSSEALDVAVLRGLPPVWFGRTIAHENMHAWLAENGIRPRSNAIGEGLCELAAYGWLKGQCDPDAENLRQLIRVAPDPTYGGGFREVQAAVRVHRLTVVLDVLRRTGVLPSSAED
jgi:hypothetical protein